MVRMALEIDNLLRGPRIPSARLSVSRRGVNPKEATRVLMTLLVSCRPVLKPGRLRERAGQSTGVTPLAVAPARVSLPDHLRLSRGRRPPERMRVGERRKVLFPGAGCGTPVQGPRDRNGRVPPHASVVDVRAGLLRNPVGDARRARRRPRCERSAPDSRTAVEAVVLVPPRDVFGDLPFDVLALECVEELRTVRAGAVVPVIAAVWTLRRAVRGPSMGTQWSPRPRLLRAIPTLLASRSLLNNTIAFPPLWTRKFRVKFPLILLP